MPHDRTDETSPVDAATSPAQGPSRPSPVSPARASLDRDSLLIVAIGGMHSHACEEAVIGELNALDGVREAEIDFPSGQASVIFDARRVAAHELLAAIERAGYRPGTYHLGSGGGSFHARGTGRP